MEGRLTRLLLLAVVALSVRFALRLVYGWRPAPRVDGLERLVGSLKTFQVDRDAWPEGVGWDGGPLPCPAGKVNCPCERRPR